MYSVIESGHDLMIEGSGKDKLYHVIGLKATRHSAQLLHSLDVKKISWPQHLVSGGRACSPV